MDTMPAAEAMELLRKSQPLADVRILGNLNPSSDPFLGTIYCTYCHLESFSVDGVIFEEPVHFLNCRLGSLGVYATYFRKGLVLEECIVTSRVDFQCGGHNHEPIEIINTIFKSYVDFWDCWFMAPVRFKDVTFLQGTNMLGHARISFNGGLELNNVQGDLAVDEDDS